MFLFVCLFVCLFVYCHLSDIMFKATTETNFGRNFVFKKAKETVSFLVYLFIYLFIIGLFVFPSTRECSYRESMTKLVKVVMFFKFKPTRTHIVQIIILRILHLSFLRETRRKCSVQAYCTHIVI